MGLIGVPSAIPDFLSNLILCLRFSDFSAYINFFGFIVAAQFCKVEKMVDLAKRQKVIVVGAGPVGSLAALYAAARGDEVELYELRAGMLSDWIYVLRHERPIMENLRGRGDDTTAAYFLSSYSFNPPPPYANISCSFPGFDF